MRSFSRHLCGDVKNLFKTRSFRWHRNRGPRLPGRLLFVAQPVEYAADAPTSVERFLLVRVQAVIKRLKLGLDCLQTGKLGIRHLFGEGHSAGRRRKIWLVSA